MSKATKTSVLDLPDPEFSLEKDNPNLELWTFRLPTHIPICALNNLKMENILSSKQQHQSGGNISTAKFQHNGKSYHLLLSDTLVENESFRVLTPKEKDGSDEGDDNDVLNPCSKPFSKHFNVLADVPELSETKLAPREGPPAQDDTMRSAYRHVPQRAGLKRRWMPLGTKLEKNEEEVVSPPPTKRMKTDSTDSSAPNTVTDKNSSTKKTKAPEEKAAKEAAKSAKKALKEEKKALKKAKKEAKKAKKNKTKIKEE